MSYYTLPKIDPIMLSIGPVSIHWYGAMYLIGLLFALGLAYYRAKNKDNSWSTDEVVDLLLWCFFGVIIGGRIGYVLFYNFPIFLQNPLYLFKVWEGGMSFHGGLLGVLVVMFIWSKKKKKLFFVTSDFIAPLVPFGLGMGRIGNLINGELWGRVTNVPWGIVFPNAGPLPRHPSQLYEFFLEGVLLFIILNVFRQKTRPVGAVSGLFLIFYGLFRFIIEFFREPDQQLGLFFNVISMGQILSLPMILGGFIIVFVSYKKKIMVK